MFAFTVTVLTYNYIYMYIVCCHSTIISNFAKTVTDFLNSFADRLSSKFLAKH